MVNSRSNQSSDLDGGGNDRGGRGGGGRCGNHNLFEKPWAQGPKRFTMEAAGDQKYIETHARLGWGQWWRPHHSSSQLEPIQSPFQNPFQCPIGFFLVPIRIPIKKTIYTFKSFFYKEINWVLGKTQLGTGMGSGLGTGMGSKWGLAKMCANICHPLLSWPVLASVCVIGRGNPSAKQ